MTPDAFEIRDYCRKNLVKYTLQAFDSVPVPDNPLILDAGCGTGVQTLAIAEKLSGKIYAVDSDRDSIVRLREKTESAGLQGRIAAVENSVFSLPDMNLEFDIILAEGLLNVIGFERGLRILKKCLKEGGYIILHDELKDDSCKKELMKERGLSLVTSFELNEEIWRQEYYGCLEREIERSADRQLFKKEIEEIELCRKRPHLFRSVYYVLEDMSFK